MVGEKHIQEQDVTWRLSEDCEKIRNKWINIVLLTVSRILFSWLCCHLPLFLRIFSEWLCSETLLSVIDERHVLCRRTRVSSIPISLTGPGLWSYWLHGLYLFRPRAQDRRWGSETKNMKVRANISLPGLLSLTSERDNYFNRTSRRGCDAYLLLSQEDEASQGVPPAKPGLLKLASCVSIQRHRSTNCKVKWRMWCQEG